MKENSHRIYTLLSITKNRDNRKKRCMWLHANSNLDIKEELSINTLSQVINKIF